jgi:hypothetical protein
MDTKIKAMILRMYCMGAAPSTIVKRAREAGVMPRDAKVAIKQAHEVLMERLPSQEYYGA